MQNTNGGHGMSRFGSSVMAGEQILKLPFEKRYFIPGFLRRQMRKDTQAVLNHWPKIEDTHEILSNGLCLP